MGEQTTAGTTVFIGTTADNAETDMYTEIGLVESVGEIGRVYNPVNFTPLKDRGVRKHKGSFNDGDPVLVLGKDLNDDGQAAVAAALLTDYDYNFKIVDNDDVPPTTATVTMTTGTPGQVTDTAHGFVANTAVKFTTTGALPSGLVAGTTYYIKTVVDADTYTLSATKGGAAINFAASPAQSGTHTRETVPAGSYQTFKAKVMGWQDAPRAGDAVIRKNLTLGIKSGSISEQIHLP